MTTDRVTRFTSELVDSAAAEGARENRSARQQLEHWVRVGRTVTSQHSVSSRRVQAAMAGTLPFSELTVEEGAVLNAQIDAGIEERLANTHYGDMLAAQGITTVAVDDDGHLVEYRPDGSTLTLD